ncbi:MAG: ABC transporter substrate-binding protein, partial [Deltaproteobacteria bacterium]|nr:ABC transporter substrate-binding protein [Deltaproteobacteria bacterium]
PADFDHFDYVDPNAPKGGRLKQATIGTFDSFNPFIVKGMPAGGLAQIWDTLLVPSADEPFSEYGLLAESVETPADRSWATFRLRPEAKWHDGKPVTAEDVLWTFDVLRKHGQPFYRAYYGNVERAERLDERTVRFTFKPGENRELPLILGQINVLPKHDWEKRDFAKTTLEPPLGSGAYKIERFEPGRAITYSRVPDYWGKDLGVNRGRHNFDEIQVDYYRDGTVALEAFKAGEYDFRPENASKAWATSYDFPAVKNGLVKREEIPHSRPAPAQMFAFNTRREIFADPRVRRAFAYTFDFEWSNKTLFYDQYERSRSYFDNSELAATGLPTGEELAILAKYRGRIPEEVFTTQYQPPKTDGSGNVRENLREAIRVFGEAGWKVDPKTRKLTHENTGKTMSFEVLLVQPEFERIVLPWKKNLERVGIDMSVRTVDAPQYRSRLDDFDFDMIVSSVPNSRSPGNEQRGFWSSAYASQPGSQNLMGVHDPVVDELVELVIAAPDRPSLVARTRALDRVLQWGHWGIPQWHVPHDRVAYWDKLGHPTQVPPDGVQIDAWWIDAQKEAALDARRGGKR